MLARMAGGARRRRAALHPHDPEVANRFDVGRASVNRLMRQLRETGEISPKPATGGREWKIDDGGLMVLRECTAALGNKVAIEIRRELRRCTSRPLGRPRWSCKLIS